MNNCVLSGNSAEDGGGVSSDGGALNNCLLVGNTADSGGGGASAGFGELNNCTVIGNTAGEYVGGVIGYKLILNNCIVWGNHAESDPNIHVEYSTVSYTCSDPVQPGTGNISADPLFKNPLSNFRLRQGSPCIDAGSNLYAPAPDLDGIARPFDGDTNGVAVADMGCYEWDLSSLPKTCYVDASRTDDSGAATNWATAKQTIQAAVDLATDEDTVLVTNGVYDAGGMVAPVYIDTYGDSYTNNLMNRVCLTKAITVCSVNGAEATVIQGASDNGGFGPAAVRCAYLSGAVLEGFTLTDGHTADGEFEGMDSYGGGAILSKSAALNGCILIRNSAAYGGGALLLADAVLNNCMLSYNLAQDLGGGALCGYGGGLNNCLVNKNIAGYSGGGVYLEDGTLNNCTISGNTVSDEYGGGGGVHAYYSTLNNCIVWGNHAESDPNIDAYISTVRYVCSDPVQSGEGNINADPLFKNPDSNFRLRQGSPCVDTGSNLYAPATDLEGVIRPFDGDTNGVAVADMGCYELSAASFPQTYYVDASRSDDSGAATNWATAKQTTQAAVDLATDEDTVLVTNGVYSVGGTVAPPYTLEEIGLETYNMTNRVCIIGAITIRSVNGADVTVIEGASDNGELGPAAVRCAYLLSGAVMEGFTLTGGYTGDQFRGFGGGALVLMNSMINKCKLIDNHSMNGGGAFCASGGMLNNCLLSRNRAVAGGGAMIISGSINNCTVFGNTAYGFIDDDYFDVIGGFGGRVSFGDGFVNNCIVWGNTADITEANISAQGNAMVRYTCSDPLLPGEGNINADSLFVDSTNSNFCLQAGSPCINAGDNSYVVMTNDLDGNPRVIGGVVDVGAYENQNAGTDADHDDMDDLWELNHFGGRHFADPATAFGNGINTLREAYIIGLDPNNPGSKFAMSIQPGSLLQWPCVSGRVYSVYCSTNLLTCSPIDGAQGWQPVETNIPWTVGAFTDTNSPADGQMFYKIGVELAP